MPARLVHLFLLVLLFLSFSLNVIQWKNARESYIVVAVPDGDSLDLADGRRIRLLGIDAPERGRCMAEEARSHLSLLVLKKRISLSDTVADDYGRILANVSVAGTRVNEEMVQRGLAKNRSAHSNPSYRVLTDTQEVAKSAKLGIWSDGCRGKTSSREDCTIKGNIRQGKKQYYLPDCPNYPDVIIDTAFGDAWFCSEGEAARFGFTPAC